MPHLFTRLAYPLLVLLALLNARPAAAQTWQWTARTEGIGTNYSVLKMTTDAAGNVYLAGRHTGAVHAGSIVVPAPSRWSMFVAKVSPTGQWLWVRTTGNGIFEEVTGLAVDATGTHVYVAGTLSSGTYVLGSSTVTIPPVVCTHGAVFGSLSAATGAWEWAQGANNGSGIKGLAVGADGSLTVGGYCKGTNFKLGAATVPGTLPDRSLFAARFSATGQPRWITAAVAPTPGMAWGFALDAAGNSYLSGYFQGSVQFGATTLTSQGGYDGFVAGLSPTGAWQGALRFGGSSHDYASALVADNRGGVYVVGSCRGAATVGTTAFPSVGGEYGVVARLSAPGWQWQWALRPTGTENGVRSAALDGAGRLYVAGEMRGPTTFGTRSLAPTATEKAYWAELDVTSRQWQRAHPLPADVGNSDQTALTATPAGTLYLGGLFSGTITLGAASYSAPGRADVYVGKLTLPSTVQAPAPARGPVGTRVVLRGSRFEAVSQVTLAGRPAAFTLNSPDQLTVTVPAGVPLGAAPFVLSTPNGPLSSAAFTVSTVTAALAPAAGLQLHAYPNPARQQLRVAGTRGHTVLLLDARGRVCALPALSTHPDGVTLSVAGLPAGLYLLRAGAQHCRVLIQP
ncbi:IPT/TIG domain-containing protein [Hymenobacter sp. B81]|uniref:IPT/TIG domain-containing protein n=1 Tax=Hymenobacter sp. B81 TaxID=3344878 RepID=UPI0037DBF69A